jgi:hypothetical protein
VDGGQFDIHTRRERERAHLLGAAGDELPRACPADAVVIGDDEAG